MMELWGAESCKECKVAKEWLRKTPIEWKYIPVEDTGFEGQIPRVITDDGKIIIGFGQIKRYILLKMKEMGFQEG